MKAQKLVVVAALLMGLCGSLEAAEARKRVALMDFDFGTVQRWWSGNWDIGKGIADLVVTNLVKDGTYSVIERKKLDTILQEQNSNTDRANPTSAAKSARCSGSMQSSWDRSRSSVSRTSRPRSAGLAAGSDGWPVVRSAKRSWKANVAIDARLVNVDTGEIVMSPSGKGTSKRPGCCSAAWARAAAATALVASRWAAATFRTPSSERLFALPSRTSAQHRAGGEG